MKKIILFIFSILLISCNGNAQKESKNTYKISKTDAEWQQQLTQREYMVMRKSGTEPAFSSPFNKNYNKGTYVCKGCDTPLFKSANKFDSGTGWPSFDREIKGNVAYSKDSHSIYGNEEHCATCGSHLGHVFNDGPRNTTGKRHCINGVALRFVPDTK